jgi:hypothetical protein
MSPGIIFVRPLKMSQYNIFTTLLRRNDNSCGMVWQGMGMKGTKSMNKKMRFAGLTGAAVLSFTALAGNTPPGSYVAHEWGTFTSVQSADGKLLTWSPLESSHLPEFVYDWSRPGINCQPAADFVPVKAQIRTLQRMETPVIYFYSKEEREVDVSVRFPDGRITEWYPQANRIGPSRVPATPIVQRLDGYAHQAGLRSDLTFASLLHNEAATGDSRAYWDRIRIMPREQNKHLEAKLPADKAGSHYFTARQAGADYLRVEARRASGTAAEIEKFIFYRGVGSFATPLRVSIGLDHTVTVANNGREPLHHLYVLVVENGKGRFERVNTLGAGLQRPVLRVRNEPLKTRDVLASELCQQMAESLAKEGLYAREAKAMVETWRDSWFEEDGMRVLYVLPRAWTDRTLPLSLRPEPSELVRVMVGRAEVLPPELEQRLAGRLARAAEGNAEARAAAVEDFRRLGRFAQPALELAVRNATQEVQTEAWGLLQQAR